MTLASGTSWDCPTFEAYLSMGLGSTDAGLVHLKRMTNLSKLEIRGTRVTDAGVRELQQALPGLTIYR